MVEEALMAAEMYVTGMDRIDWRRICTCLELRQLAPSLRKAQCMAGVGGGGDAWAAQAAMELNVAMC